jgi:hypothetical protein
MKVLIYVDISKEVGDVDHHRQKPKAFALFTRDAGLASRDNGPQIGIGPVRKHLVDRFLSDHEGNGAGIEESLASGTMS